MLRLSLVTDFLKCNIKGAYRKYPYLYLVDIQFSFLHCSDTQHYKIGNEGFLLIVLAHIIQVRR